MAMAFGYHGLHYGPNGERFTVREYRSGNRMTIWVGDEYGHPKYSRSVCLKWYPWHRGSPTARLIATRERAQRKADKLNHIEMYVSHDIEVSKR